MEISLEEKRKNIQRITQTVDFGLNITQTVGDIEKLPPQRKQEICLFRFSNPNSPVFAYRLIKNPNKLREYLACIEYNPDDIGYPAIRYLNAVSSEVVTDWIIGERLAYFDRPQRLQPKVGTDELNSVMSCLTRLHRHTSTTFSNVELVPRTHQLAIDEQAFLSPKRYHPRMVESYSLVFDPIEQARNQGFISMTEYQSIKGMASYVLKIIESSNEVIKDFGNFSLLHGDVHAENIIKTPEGMKLIDFENMHYGDRAVEIAYFLEHCSQAGFINQKDVDTLVDHYLELLAKDCPDAVDQNFKDRLKIVRAYLTVKLLGMLSNGYTSSDQNSINKALFEDVLLRSKIVITNL